MANRSAASPMALSPRPNPPGTKIQGLPQKGKALAILNSHGGTGMSKSPVPAVVGTEADKEIDLAEQMNDQVRQKYVLGKRLGEGTYATVYEGHLRHDPSHLVAVKKLKINADYKDGISMDTIREIKCLSELSHPNIVSLYDVFSTKDQNMSIVLEHLPAGDLEGVWRGSPIHYTGADIKAWANMLMQAVWFCHENFILHRDIKSNNVLVAADGTIKLADFGLARNFADPGVSMTYNVITRWYRPPELLYGAHHYSGAVDIWSVACVIAELSAKEFFLQGETDLDQIAKITEWFGTPTEETWPGVSKLRYYLPPGKDVKRPVPLSSWQQRFGNLGDGGVELLRGMLVMDPKYRWNARKILDNAYWTKLPRPTKKESLPRQGGGPAKMAEDLKRQAGHIDTGRSDKVARKLDFGSMR